MTDAGGNPEIIKNNFNGLVTKNDDADEFAQAISKLTSDKALRSEMAMNAKRRFSDLFLVDKMCQGFEKIYG